MRDFFIELDALDLDPRSDMASMAHPIFSLSTLPERQVLRYESGTTFVEIQPSARGLATIFDKDILIFCISKLIDRRNRGETIGPVVRIATHDMLVSTNRQTGGISYARLEHALDRLAGTRIKTNIRTGDEVTTQNFGLIEWYDYNRKGSGFAERLRHLDIKLSDFLYRAVATAEVLPISRDYFRLRRPIDRRLYELARKHCGRQPSWRIGLANLKSKCGSRQAMKHFAAHLRGLVTSNHLPEYAVRLEADQVVFSKRQAEQATAPAPVMVAAPADARRDNPVPSKRAIRISTDAFDRIHDVAPGWDRYALESLYLGWAADKDPARNEDARFLGWVKNFTKGRRA